jgi:hypothetical protein
MGADDDNPAAVAADLQCLLGRSGRFRGRRDDDAIGAPAVGKPEHRVEGRGAAHDRMLRHQGARQIETVRLEINS